VLDAPPLLRVHVYLLFSQLLAVAAEKLRSHYYLNFNNLLWNKAVLEYHWRLHAERKSGTTI